MRSSVISVFSRPECLQAAMRASSGLTLFATRVVGFQARLNQITLDQVRLCVAEENTPRIAFIKVPNDEVLVLTTMGGSPQVCAGIVVRSADVVVLGPGVGTYARTDSSCQWAAIWFPVDEFARYGRALIGEDVAVIGSPCVWHPAAVATRGLRRMLVGAVRLAKAKPRVTDDTEATHGFEQQLIHAVFDCLSGPMKAAPSTGVSCEALLARLDELVATNPTEHRTVDAVSRSLKVSHQRLYRCCVEQLGMSPSAYLRLRRLHFLHDALQHARPGSLRVSDAARRCGLPWRGSVATTYRRLFGESPSATLRYPPPTGGCAGLFEPNSMPRQSAVAFA